jgi:hypothetical protein
MKSIKGSLPWAYRDIWTNDGGFEVYPTFGGKKPSIGSWAEIVEVYEQDEPGLAEEIAKLVAAAPETAAERDTLKASHAELLSALKPFAKAADGFDRHPVKDPEQWYAYSGIRTGGEPDSGAITVGDLRRARAAITNAEKL